MTQIASTAASSAFARRVPGARRIALATFAVALIGTCSIRRLASWPGLVATAAAAGAVAAQVATPAARPAATSVPLLQVTGLSVSFQLRQGFLQKAPQELVALLNTGEGAPNLPVEPIEELILKPGLLNPYVEFQGQIHVHLLSRLYELLHRTV